jgi:phage terminase Nu1 subunit (DNA packaging protein)
MAKTRQGKSDATGHVADSPQPPRPASALVSRRDLAALLEVHMMTVTKWERDGMPVAHRGGRGRPSLYDAAVVRAWKDARDAAAVDAVDGTLEQARIRRENSQAALNEQKLAVQQRKLLPVEEVEKAWMREVTAVRTVILASYTSHADRIFRAGVLDGVAGVEREMKALAHEILRELAEPKPKSRRAKKTAAA